MDEMTLKTSTVVVRGNAQRDSVPVIPEALYQTYLEKLIAGDRADCIAVVNKLMDQGLDVRRIYLDLFQRSLYDVGTMWERNEISVAVEHLATAITESVLTLLYPVIFRSERIGKKAVIACLANEYHQIGGKIVADIFELNGWDSYFLGANTPTADLIDIISKTGPDIVGLSLAVYFHIPQLLETIEEIRSVFPESRIIVGGQAFQWGGAELLQRYRNLVHVTSIEQLENQIIGATYNG
jgi:MerR family transcriptional regulator, light-induced transcriptional regulator